MKKSQANIYHQTIAAAFLISGTFNLVAPEMAAGNKPDDTAITNTATITYSDFKGKRSEDSSNSVINTLIKVTGITTTPNGILDVDTSTIQPNDFLNYNYVVNSSDNNLNRMFIPSTTAVREPNKLFDSK